MSDNDNLVQIEKKRGPAALSLLAGPRKPRQWNKRTAHAGIYWDRYKVGLKKQVWRVGSNLNQVGGGPWCNLHMKGSGKLVEVKVDLYYYCMYTAHFSAHFSQCVLDMLSYVLFLIIVFSLVEVI